jgi:hypothetical protein
MKKREFSGAVRKANDCFAWVLLYGEDGEYIRIAKRELLYLAKHAQWDIVAEKRMHADGVKFDLYIN